MAKGSDNDFAEVTEEMTLGKFKMWTVESLQTYLSFRNKSPEGDSETLVYKLVLFYHSTEIVLVYLSQINKDIVSVLYVQQLHQ